MSDGEVVGTLGSAETEFRRRLAIKLRARGYDEQALERKIEELLRKEIPLRLLPDDAGDLSAP
jgi:hypothetical protein